MARHLGVSNANRVVTAHVVAGAQSPMPMSNACFSAPISLLKSSSGSIRSKDSEILQGRRQRLPGCSR